MINSSPNNKLLILYLLKYLHDKFRKPMISLKYSFIYTFTPLYILQHDIYPLISKVVIYHYLFPKTVSKNNESSIIGEGINIQGIYSKKC